MNEIQFYANEFTELSTAPFSIHDYSRLKFGCDASARIMGNELAVKFFKIHGDKLLSNNVVVIPSPYNYAKNAATVMTHYFVRTLNKLLVQSNGEHVEYSTIHRKQTYTLDYGHLPKDLREKYLNNDSFYINKKFYEGKLLIFVDDVIITGTHEDKLRDILSKENMDNDVMYVYYSKYKGDRATIEHDLNFSSIKNSNDVIDIIKHDDNHVIIRPLKYLLSATELDIENLINSCSYRRLEDIYYACIGEGYHKIEQFQRNIALIKVSVNAIQ